MLKINRIFEFSELCLLYDDVCFEDGKDDNWAKHNIHVTIITALYYIILAALLRLKEQVNSWAFLKRNIVMRMMTCNSFLLSLEVYGTKIISQLRFCSSLRYREK